MKDRALNEHYQQILGTTSPWVVDEVRLDVEHLVNVVRLAVRLDAICACPQCHSRTPCANDGETPAYPDISEWGQ